MASAAQEMLLKRLNDTGLADVAKAWIRSSVAKDILSSANATLVKAKPLRNDDDKLCDSLVLEHLKVRNLRYTASVLASEAPASVSSLAATADFRSGLPKSSEATGDDSTLLVLIKQLRQAEQQLDEYSHTTARASTLAAVAPPSRSDLLEQQLALVEERHALLRSAQAAADAISPQTHAAELERARREGFELGQKGNDNALAAARADEAATVRAQERARFDGLLAQYHAEARANTAASLAEMKEGVARQESLLATAREEAVSASAALRERLVVDLDTAAVREAQARRTAALDARALALERERHEDEERRLLARLNDAESRARHAESEARLSLERWKAEWTVQVAGRETTLARNEAAHTAARAALEEEQRAVATSLARLPAVEAELSSYRAEATRLKDALAAAHRANEDAVAEMARLRRDAGEDNARLVAMEAKVKAAEEAAATAKSDAVDSAARVTSSREEWTAAVRMLRDRLAAAAAKVRAQEDALARQEKDWEGKLAAAVSAERSGHGTAEARWLAERSSLLAESARAKEEAGAEARRADECAAALAGEKVRTAELTRLVAELRARVSASGPSSDPLLMPLAGGVPVGSRPASGSSSLNASFVNAAAGLAGLGGAMPLASSMPVSSSLEASRAALARAAEALGQPLGQEDLLPTALQLNSSWALGRQGYSAGPSPTGSGWTSAQGTPARPTGPAPAAVPQPGALGSSSDAGSTAGSTGSNGARPPLPAVAAGTSFVAATGIASRRGSTSSAEEDDGQ